MIFGREEARLVYLGVSHSLPPAPHRRLVVDIGGGSTEFVIGTGYEPELMESLRIGSVSHSLRFFPDGRIDKQAMKKAELAASNEIERMVKEYRRTGWKQAIGSSGTAKSLAAILAENGWSNGAINADGLDRLRSQFLKAGDVDKLDLPGLRADRAAILPGGLAIMVAVFEGLGLDEMEVAEGALRQGVLHDLLGRVQHHDMRELTVKQFIRRYHVDAAPGRAGRNACARALPCPRRARARGDSRCWRGRRGCTRSGSRSRTPPITSTRPTSLSNADMPGFRRTSRHGSRGLCSRTAASWRRSRAPGAQR